MDRLRQGVRETTAHDRSQRLGCLQPPHKLDGSLGLVSSGIRHEARRGQCGEIIALKGIACPQPHPQRSRGGRRGPCVHERLGQSTPLRRCRRLARLALGERDRAVRQRFEALIDPAHPREGPEARAVEHERNLRKTRHGSLDKRDDHRVERIVNLHCNANRVAQLRECCFLGAIEHPSESLHGALGHVRASVQRCQGQLAPNPYGSRQQTFLAQLNRLVNLADRPVGRLEQLAGHVMLWLRLQGLLQRLDGDVGMVTQKLDAHPMLQKGGAAGPLGQPIQQPALGSVQSPHAPPGIHGQAEADRVGPITVVEIQEALESLLVASLVNVLLRNKASEQPALRIRLVKPTRRLSHARDIVEQPARSVDGRQHLVRRVVPRDKRRSLLGELRGELRFAAPVLFGENARRPHRMCPRQLRERIGVIARQLNRPRRGRHRLVSLPNGPARPGASQPHGFGVEAFGCCDRGLEQPRLLQEDGRQLDLEGHETLVLGPGAARLTAHFPRRTQRRDHREHATLHQGTLGRCCQLAHRGRRQCGARHRHGEVRHVARAQVGMIAHQAHGKLDGGVHIVITQPLEQLGHSLEVAGPPRNEAAQQLGRVVGIKQGRRGSGEPRIVGICLIQLVHGFGEQAHPAPVLSQVAAQADLAVADRRRSRSLACGRDDAAAVGERRLVGGALRVRRCGGPRPQCVEHLELGAVHAPQAQLRIDHARIQHGGLRHHRPAEAVRLQRLLVVAQPAVRVADHPPNLASLAVERAKPVGVDGRREEPVREIRHGAAQLHPGAIVAQVPQGGGKNKVRQVVGGGIVVEGRSLEPGACQQRRRPREITLVGGAQSQREEPLAIVRLDHHQTLVQTRRLCEVGNRKRQVAASQLAQDCGAVRVQLQSALELGDRLVVPLTNRRVASLDVVTQGFIRPERVDGGIRCGFLCVPG